MKKKKINWKYQNKKILKYYLLWMKIIDNKEWYSEELQIYQIKKNNQENFQGEGYLTDKLFIKKDGKV